MQVIIGETVVAQAETDGLVQIEGNPYFPPTSVRWEFFEDSTTPYTCPWKGRAQYWDVRTSSGLHHDAAWAYPEPIGSALERVGRDFSGYVAFDATQAQMLEPGAGLGLD